MATPNPPPPPVASPGPCFLSEELESTTRSDVEDDAAWARHARERLLPADRAEELVAPLAWRALEALAAERFARLSALVGPDGLCLRAAKGAECVQLTAGQVASCGRDRTKRDWPVDAADDGPHLYTCGEALRTLFLPKDARHPTSVTHNCFPRPGRGNNADPLVLRPAKAFVEFHYERQPWLGLWLVFDSHGEAPGSDPCTGRDVCDDRGDRLYLVELIAEYWGI